MANILVSIHPRHAHSSRWLDAFAEGLFKHGVCLAQSNADLAVVWSINDPIYIARREQQLDTLVLECGYLGDRLQHASAGFNGLNGRAEFHTEHVDEQRAKKWAHMLQPEHKGDVVTIMGQVVTDSAVKHVNFKKWIEHSAAQLHAYGYDVVFRPHPKGSNASVQLPLITDEYERVLQRSKWIVTFNSNAGVDAALAGCAVTAQDIGSMVYDIADHDLIYKPIANRKRWLERLAYCQWTLDEMRSGLTWEHLKCRYQ